MDYNNPQILKKLQAIYDNQQRQDTRAQQISALINRIRSTTPTLSPPNTFVK
jgi:hypothetical protein